jgi:hypothetical protein
MIDKELTMEEIFDKVHELNKTRPDHYWLVLRPEVAAEYMDATSNPPSEVQKLCDEISNVLKNLDTVAPGHDISEEELTSLLTFTSSLADSFSGKFKDLDEIPQESPPQEFPEHYWPQQWPQLPHI